MRGAPANPAQLLPTVVRRGAITPSSSSFRHFIMAKTTATAPLLASVAVIVVPLLLLPREIGTGCRGNRHHRKVFFPGWVQAGVEAPLEMKSSGETRSRIPPILPISPIWIRILISLFILNLFRRSFLHACHPQCPPPPSFDAGLPPSPTFFPPPPRPPCSNRRSHHPHRLSHTDGRRDGRTTTLRLL